MLEGIEFPASAVIGTTSLSNQDVLHSELVRARHASRTLNRS